MTLKRLITLAVNDNATLPWQVLPSGAIRRADGACVLEAAAGTGPHSLWTKARSRFAELDDRTLELISCASDMDWWPHRMAEYTIRKQILEAFGLEDAPEMVRREEAA